MLHPRTNSIRGKNAASTFRIAVSSHSRQCRCHCRGLSHGKAAQGADVRQSYAEKRREKPRRGLIQKGLSAGFQDFPIAEKVPIHASTPFGRKEDRPGEWQRDANVETFTTATTPVPDGALVDRSPGKCEPN